jgi:hypothetical protein
MFTLVSSGKLLLLIPLNGRVLTSRLQFYEFAFKLLYEITIVIFVSNLAILAS